MTIGHCQWQSDSWTVETVVVCIYRAEHEKLLILLQNNVVLWLFNNTHIKSRVVKVHGPMDQWTNGPMDQWIFNIWHSLVTLVTSIAHCVAEMVSTHHLLCTGDFLYEYFCVSLICMEMIVVQLSGWALGVSYHPIGRVNSQTIEFCVET